MRVTKVWYKHSSHIDIFTNININLESISVITGSSTSFWKLYFKSCAHSSEVFRILLSKLTECHPRDSEDGCNDRDEIIRDLANVSYGHDKNIRKRRIFKKIFTEA